MKIKFNSRYHRYSYGDKKLTSISRFIDQFHEPFEEMKIAAIVARKKQLPIKTILADWKRARDDGTNVHKLCEQLLINKELNNIEPKYEEYVQSAFKFLKTQFKDIEYTYMQPEMICYSVNDNIAGTSDIVYIDKDKKFISIYDWKKVDKFDMISYNNKMMYEPVQHLADTKYNKYALQLSCYAYMLELMYPDYKIQEIAFIQLTKNGYVKYNTPYLKTDVINMLNKFNEDKQCHTQQVL